MTIAAASGFQFPTAPIVRTINTRDADSSAPESPVNSEQFAALMAQLANTNPQLRNSLMKQVPANGVGLLDQLLSGAHTGELSETLASALTGALARTQSNTQVGNDTNSALDAARYGLLTGSGLSTATTKSPEGGNQNRISNAVLSRIAARKSPSVDELLAVGDRDGALARAKLDALLATAGTTEGAKLAASNALAAQLLQSANNPATPITNTDGLDPEFKSRLDRVISRMKNETGLDVTLVETVRSQDRQNALYAQGRTTPGDVVTWTQDSMHTRGQAADLMVGGSFNNPPGFARLQKIALEEGLHTLGPSDPGHVEMSRNSQALDAAARALTAANARVINTSNSGVARVASVAQVASIGNNAGVASDSSSNSTRVPAALNSATTAAPTWNDGNSPKSTGSDSQSSDNAGERPATTTRNSKTAVTDNNNVSAFGDMSRSNETRFIGPKEAIEVPKASPVDGAQRVQNIDALRDQSATKSLSQLTLEIDGVNGEAQQITVDLRGKVVGTQISTDDASAQRLRPHIGELQSALLGRGLEADVVRISSNNARATDVGDQAKLVSGGERDVMRMSGSTNTQTGEGAAQQQQRERSSSARDWDDHQAARDEQRRNAKQQEQQYQQQYQQRPHNQEKQ